MASAFQWFLFAMFVWACCLVMSALESRVSASGQAKKARQDGSAGGQRRTQQKRQPWWRGLLVDDDEEDDTEQPSHREHAMASEIVELKDRIATLEAIVTDRKFQWEEELNKRN